MWHLSLGPGVRHPSPFQRSDDAMYALTGNRRLSSLQRATASLGTSPPSPFSGKCSYSREKVKMEPLPWSFTTLTASKASLYPSSGRNCRGMIFFADVRQFLQATMLQDAQVLGDISVEVREGSGCVPRTCGIGTCNRTFGLWWRKSQTACRRQSPRGRRSTSSPWGQPTPRSPTSGRLWCRRL